MSLFGFGHTTDRYGVIVDIGSGSVLAAIVHSNPSQKHPQVVWSHREHAPLRNVDSLERSAKSVMAALVTVLMQLDSEGRKVLHDYSSSAKLTELLCGISAPWSYTVTKATSYKQEDPFVITEEMIEELVFSIQRKIESDLKENEALQNLGLQVIAQTTLGMTANGYQVVNKVGQKANEIEISHTTVVSQKYLLDAIDEMHAKLFAPTKLTRLSFILMLYAVNREFFSKTQDVCLVDITYEATEIGIVRDGILTYCTHTSFGTFSLAREISTVIGVPLHEAFGYLHTDKPYTFMENLNPTQRAECEAVFEAYTERIVELFNETGDTLSIPSRISLHADLNTEPLFLDLMEKAGKRSIKTTLNVTAITMEIIKQTYEVSTKASNQTIPIDTALLLSAQFFHNNHKHKTFEYT